MLFEVLSEEDHYHGNDISDNLFEALFLAQSEEKYNRITGWEYNNDDKEPDFQEASDKIVT